MSKGQIILYSSLSVLVISFFAIILFSFDKEADNSSLTAIPRLAQDEEFTLEDMTTFVSDDYVSEDDIEVDEKVNITELLKQKLKEKKQVEIVDTLSKEVHDNMVNDSLLQAMIVEQESQDRIFEEKIRLLELEEAKEAKRLEHIRYLKKKRKAEKEEKRRRELNKIEEVEAAIYTSQRVMPNDRVKLILTKDAKIFGKEYQRGTYLLAYIAIKDSRIFLDIDNIQGQPLHIRAYDSYDFREGLYSKRAAALWDEYKNEQARKGNNELSHTISNTTSSSMVGNVVQDLGAFFRKKKVREQNKILLVDNHTVILKIKRKENP